MQSSGRRREARLLFLGRRREGRVAQRIIHDDGLPLCDRSHGMQRVRRDDPNRARTRALSSSTNAYFQFAFDDLPDLLLRMRMLMDGRACIEFIMRERHAWRCEIATSPARQAFNDRQRTNIDEPHDSFMPLFNSTSRRGGSVRFFDGDVAFGS